MSQLTSAWPVKLPASGAGVLAVGAAGAVGSTLGAAVAVVATASTRAITEPSDTRSPSCTFTSRMRPAVGAGTSMVALSDSRVTRASSTWTVSPALTSSSMTGTSLKSPMSGTFTSIRSISVSLYSMTRRKSARSLAR